MQTTIALAFVGVCAMAGEILIRKRRSEMRNLRYDRAPSMNEVPRPKYQVHRSGRPW